MSGHAAFTSALGPSITRYLALKEALGRAYAGERRVFEHVDRFLARYVFSVRQEFGPPSRMSILAACSPVKPFRVTTQRPALEAGATSVGAWSRRAAAS
jgi:hypothetical protein